MERDADKQRYLTFPRHAQNRRRRPARAAHCRHDHIRICDHSHIAHDIASSAMLYMAIERATHSSTASVAAWVHGLLSDRCVRTRFGIQENPDRR
jgi:hypothetical protein